MAYQEGQQLGNYRIIQELVRGGFADVYLGQHIHLGTQVAIKVFNKYISTDFFLREARTFVELKHPHILRVLDYAVENNTPFLVTDYAPNGSLRWYHRRGSVLPIATVVSYVGQVADALQYLHDHKLIHRYAWPQNMFLGRNDEVLLDIPTRIVIGETFIGTPPPYMAPEQRYGNPSPASDQYALGAVAYEWLSGDIPSTMSSPFHPLPLSPLREKVPTIPPSVEAIILKALAKDPQQRFPSVKEFANALEQASKFAQSTFAAQPPSVSLKEQTPPVAPSIDKCPYCGAETRPGDNFCLNCGNRLPAATSTTKPIIPASNDRAVVESAATLDKVENPAHFIIRNDKGIVLQEYRLDKFETVIGRAPTSDIVLSKDKFTSRRHAVVRYEHGHYVLSDERSANGTFVNGQQLEELVPRILKDGDHVGIGEHELIFRTDAPTGVEKLRDPFTLTALASQVVGILAPLMPFFNKATHVIANKVGEDVYEQGKHLYDVIQARFAQETDNGKSSKVLQYFTEDPKEYAPYLENKLLLLLQADPNFANTLVQIIKAGPLQEMIFADDASVEDTHRNNEWGQLTQNVSQNMGSTIEVTDRTREVEPPTKANRDDFRARSMDIDADTDAKTSLSGRDASSQDTTKVDQIERLVRSISKDLMTPPSQSGSSASGYRVPIEVPPYAFTEEKVLSLFAIARATLEKDDRAFVGKYYTVQAGISQSKPEGFEGEPFKLPLPSSIRFLFVDILLHTSSNIELISHWQRRLRYDSHNPEPQLVGFKFKVVTPGSCSLAIDFYYERRWLRTVHFEFDAVEQSQLTAISSEG